MRFFQGQLGRRLLGRAPRCPAAGDTDLQLRDRALDLELLIMRRAVRGHHGVLRQRDFMTLEILLQQRLGVLAQRARIDLLQDRDVQLADQGTSRIEAAIEEHRAEDRLQRIGQDRRPAKPTALELALAQAQLVRQQQHLRDLVQRLLLDQIGPHARQIALVQLAEHAIEHVRHGAIQDRIAEKFQALVVHRVVAAMRERLLQQLRFAEAIAKALLQCFQTHVQRCDPE